MNVSVLKHPQSACRRGATRGRCRRRPPLRKRWPSGIAATARTEVGVIVVLLAAGAHKALGGDAPHLDEVILRATDDARLPSRVTTTAKTSSVCPVKVWTSVPSTWYSRTSRRRLPADAANADHKVNAVAGSAAKVCAMKVPTADGALEAPSSVHSFTRPSYAKLLAKRSRPAAPPPPGSTSIVQFDAWMVCSHAPSRQILTVLSYAPVITLPSGAAAHGFHRASLRVPASVTTSPENEVATSVIAAML